MEDFCRYVHAVASSYLRKGIVRATTVEHRLAVAIALLAHISEWHGIERRPATRVCWDRIDKLCTIFPQLQPMVVMSATEGDLATSTIDQETIDNVANLVLQLHEAASREQQAQLQSELDTLGLKNTPSDGAVKQLKELKACSWHSLERLWDEERQVFSDDPEDWTQVLFREAMSRQGLPRGSSNHGQDLLDRWGLNLSDCRTQLNDVEIARIILDAPADKSPGPDGIPAACFKHFSRMLAPIFREAW